MSEIPSSQFSDLSQNDKIRLADELVALVVSGVSDAERRSVWFQLRKHFPDPNVLPRAILSSQNLTITGIKIREMFCDQSTRSYIAQSIEAWARNSGLNTETCSLKTLSLYEATNTVQFELVNMSENARADFLQQEERHKATEAEAKAADHVAPAPVVDGLLPPVDFWFSPDDYDRKLAAETWRSQIGR
jgi:hypothetical protein